MITVDDVQHTVTERGAVIDANGDEIGGVQQLYLDDATGDPAWITVKTGMFSGARFVPLYGATMHDRDLHVAVTKDVVKDSPNVAADATLDPADREVLQAYYGGPAASGLVQSAAATAEPAPTVMPPVAPEPFDATAPATTDDEAATQSAPSGDDVGTGLLAQTAGGAAPVSEQQGEQSDGAEMGAGLLTQTAGGAAPPAPSADSTEARDGGELDERSIGEDADDDGGATTVTLSEERLNVGTETHEASRVRLRKVVVTEQVTTTVPVQHEEIRVVREPIGAGEVGDGEYTIGEEEHEIVLHEERPVVTTETVPVERVRIETAAVRGEETVSGEVRKEQLDTDGIESGRSTEAPPA